MEHTFMTIHNLSQEANILFASESIYDILGYHPHQVQDKSCFEFFHPDEVPFARSVHSRGVQLDKAAVLHYCRILSSDGRWVSCECCFTVVHDVLIACTSIYRQGERSERRAIEAPQIRRLFSSSPRDPRYHMLEHLSPKFRMPPTEREPRAALIVNRFTRTLTVMFATNAVATILGVRPDQVKGKSFYECIQENCLPDAIRCLESAKANDSIAYLRFWYRDPRRPEDYARDEEEEELDEADRESESTSDSDGGARLDNQMDIDGDTNGPTVKVEDDESHRNLPNFTSASAAPELHRGVEGVLSHRATSTPSSRERRSRNRRRRRRADPNPSFELEAVVSCTSDGLVVVLRKARPPIPAPHPPLANPHTFENGLFAAPWGVDPVRAPEPAQHEPGERYAFRAPLLPQFMPLNEDAKSSAFSATSGGPPLEQLMRSIRDVAVFAWALVGINGNMSTYSHGHPTGEAQPPDGLPIWDPNAGDASYLGPENQAAKRWAEYDISKANAMSASPLSIARYVHSVGMRPQSDRDPEHYPQNTASGHYTYAQQGPIPAWSDPHRPQQRPHQADAAIETMSGYEFNSPTSAYFQRQRQAPHQEPDQSQQYDSGIESSPQQDSLPRHHDQHEHSWQSTQQTQRRRQQQQQPAPPYHSEGQFDAQSYPGAAGANGSGPPRENRYPWQ